MTRRSFFLVLGALLVAIATVATTHSATAEASERSCEDEPIATRFDGLECWSVQDGPITVFSTRSKAHAERLASVADSTLARLGMLFGSAPVQSGRIGLVAWPSDHSSRLAALPERLDGESLYLISGEQTNDVRSAVSDIVVNRATMPNQGQVPLWLRVALRHWVRGGNQTATLEPARKIATDPSYAYDRYFSLAGLASWPVIEAYQQIYISQSLAMLAWLLQDWPTDALVATFAQIARGDSIEESILDNYGLPAESLISAFAAEAERITQLNWPYTEPPPWHAWFTTVRIVAIAIAVLALLVLARFWWWLRHPVDVPRRRAGIELRRYLPRAGSFRF